MDRERPLAPNVKGGEEYKPIRRPLIVNGVAHYAVKGKDIIQEENGLTVTYHNCVKEDRENEWVITMARCLVTWL